MHLLIGIFVSAIVLVGAFILFEIIIPIYKIRKEEKAAKKAKESETAMEPPSDCRAKQQAAASEPLYRATFGSHTCTHGPFGSQKMLTINGKRVGVDASPFCEKCTVEYFSKYSTTCQKCGEVIAPGMPVGQHYVGNKLVTVCQRMSCAIPGDLCGHWGEGKLNQMDWGNATKPKAAEAVSPEKEAVPA